MNTQRALNGAFYGLRGSRGQQSAFAHQLLEGLEALAQERVWSTPYCGGNSEIGMFGGSARLALQWTAVEWRREDR